MELSFSLSNRIALARKLQELFISDEIGLFGSGWEKRDPMFFQPEKDLICQTAVKSLDMTSILAGRNGAKFDIHSRDTDHFYGTLQMEKAPLPNGLPDPLEVDRSGYFRISRKESVSNGFGGHHHRTIDAVGRAYKHPFKWNRTPELEKLARQHWGDAAAKAVLQTLQVSQV